ncbi:hypothetical protein F4818DRAFT_109063 [Hypoxylon cercidicola]|nr:hypothetical protein F4818DRAFT_109063 [Hypoxylon cercidicola]
MFHQVGCAFLPVFITENSEGRINDVEGHDVEGLYQRKIPLLKCQGCLPWITKTNILISGTMAEALSLIGGLSAIMQLAIYLVKSTKKLGDCVETIRSAPKEIKYFILETSIFTDQLRYFHDLAKDSAEKLDEKFKAKRARLVHKIVRQCRFVRRGFSRLVKRFVEINDTGTTPFSTLRVRVLWLWKKPDVPELRMSLQSATANVMLLCNLFSYEELIRRKANDGRLEMLQVQLQNWVSTAKTLRYDLADYQRRKLLVGNESETAIDISFNTPELERYVVRAIRSHAQEAALSRERDRSSTPGPPPPPHATERQAQETSPSPKSGIAVAQTEDREGAGQRPRPAQIPDIAIELRPSPVAPTSSESRRPHERPFGNEVRDPGRGPTPDIWPAGAYGPDVTETAKVGSSWGGGIRPRPIDARDKRDSPGNSGSKPESARSGYASPTKEHSERYGPVSSSGEARARRRPRRPKSQPPTS